MRHSMQPPVIQNSESGRGVFIINLHGIGEARRPLEPGEQDYWITGDEFEKILDVVERHPRRDRIRLTFDDGNCSDHEIAAPALLRRGLHATFFVLAGRLDRDGYLSRRQVRELCVQGFEIGSHGLVHIDWTTAGDEVLTREVQVSKAIIEEVTGCPVRVAAVPFGRYDRRVLEALRRHRYYEIFSSDGCPRLCAAWPTPRYSLRRNVNVARLARSISTSSAFPCRLWNEASVRIKASLPIASSRETKGGMESLKSFARPTIRTREMRDSDFPRVAQMLASGLGYSNQYFLRVLKCLKEHPTPTGFPKYGYVLESDSIIVGVLLLIFSTIKPGVTRCHVTSWYVEPAYKPYAALFYLRALRHSEVTYLNISARRNTIPIIEAQGFRKYSNGQFAAIPVLSRYRGEFADITEVPAVPNASFDSFEHELLTAHATFGCISIWCCSSGHAYPFVFQSRLFKGFIPGVQLIYCRDVEEFVRCAAPIGRFLASRGKLIVSIDSNGRIPGLVGKYFAGMHPRFYKGPKPRLGDLAYTQAAIAGFVRRRN